MTLPVENESDPLQWKLRDPPAKLAVDPPVEIKRPPVEIKGWP